MSLRNLGGMLLIGVLPAVTFVTPAAAQAERKPTRPLNITTIAQSTPRPNPPALAPAAVPATQKPTVATAPVKPASAPPGPCGSRACQVGTIS